MKAINLFVDFEFTSLSPDAQPISVGIVSEEYFNEQYRQLYTDKVEIKKGNCSIDHLTTKSFYAEFSDFDINRCDEWVRENVVGKLIYNEAKNTFDKFQYDAVTGNVSMKDSTSEIKGCLKAWLEQFSDYQITFVVDCGTWDWYHLLQLIGEWEETKGTLIIEESALKECTEEELVSMFRSSPTVIKAKYPSAKMIPNYIWKLGLPIISSNISPVPFELNQFIAEKKGISVREAFELNREELLIEDVSGMVVSEKTTLYGEPMQKHNAIWDAKVMKAIYEKLK